jgi:DNA-binding GntR family transcriptional regulator
MTDGRGGVTLVDQVTISIRHSIVTGELLPGETLTLRCLAQRLGVSTQPVREAVWRLKGQGLLIPAVGRDGARVPPLDPADVHGIYRLRTLLEPELAARSCLLIGEAELDALAALASSSAPRPLVEAYQVRDDLRLRLLSPAATAWDLRVLETLWWAAERYASLTDAGCADELGDGERSSVILTFRTRDMEKVAEQVRSHLESTEARIQSALASVAGIPAVSAPCL